MILTALVLVAILGIVLIVVARFARRPAPLTLPVRIDATPVGDGSGFDRESAVEFDGMPEDARCEMLFSVALLDNERSRKLLEHALSDKSRTVALAAARGLISAGRGIDVTAYIEQHPGTHSDELASALQLFDIDRD